MSIATSPIWNVTIESRSDEIDEIDEIDARARSAGEHCDSGFHRITVST